MYLCIDTATIEAGITLIDDNRSIGYLPLEASYASDRILRNIDELLKKASIKLEDLKGILVLKGPGSFTGLRVGIAVANQFAHQLKLPIVALRIEEWYSHRTDEEDFLYLQSLNRDELYVRGFGRWKGVASAPIVSVHESRPDALKNGNPKYLGQLNDFHKHEKLPMNFHELIKLKSVEDTWLNVVRSIDWKPKKTYDLIEPYYGKEPTITKSKRKLSL